MQKTILVFLMCFCVVTSYAQKHKNKSSSDRLQSPIDEKVQFSGSFAELRGTHLHGGSDIRTNAEEGKVIKAAKEGYVSKIQVDIHGYGKSITITHPNGYTTIYGHLRAFVPKLARFVKKAQQEEGVYEVVLYPKKNRFRFKVGEQIAWSGNTGHSGGPHLHFEVRDSNNTKQINPLKFDIPLTDTFPPTFDGIAIYPESKEVLPFEANTPRYFNVKKITDTQYSVDSVVEVPSMFSIGISAYDFTGENKNHNGVYSYKVFLDNHLYFYLKMDKVPLNEVSDYYSILDYSKFEKTGKHFLKTKKEPNSDVNFYNQNINNGIFVLKDTLIHKVKFILEDFSGNSSNLVLRLKTEYPQNDNEIRRVVSYTDSAFIPLKNFSVFIPKGGLYKNEELLLSIEKDNVFSVGESLQPAKKEFKIMSVISDSLKMFSDKLGWQRSLPRGKKVWISANLVNDTLIGKTRFFGKYTIEIDTLAPQLSLINKQSKYHRGDTISFRAKDTLSGINKYSASVNGKWVLLEYEPKKDNLFYVVDRKWKGRRKVLELKVIDNVGNKTFFRDEFR
ncbi:MAG: M23 family metallopeptidase [Bacteroidales bacterium]